MTKPVAIIDPSLKHPSYNCVNKIVEQFNIPITYHWVSTHGTSSLDLIEEPSAYIVFGSDSNVTDRLEWQVDIAKRMKHALARGIPVLGICFGHQLIADIFGSEVNLVVPENKCFEGIREVEILEDKFGFNKGEKFSVFITHHYEVKNLPKDFIHLATSKDCKLDGIGHKSLPFFSFQGHPEASDDFIKHHIEIDLSAKEIEAGKQGGHKVISTFLKYAKVI